MKDLLLEEIAMLSYSADESVQFNHLMSIIRATLQYCSYTAVEYWYKNTADVEKSDFGIAKQLLNPTDGSFIIVLDRILPEIRNNYWSTCADAWFKKSIVSHNSDEVQIDALVNRINEWVAFRNNRPAHGVLDLDTISNSINWLQNLARDTVLGLSDLLPVRNQQDDKLKIKTPFAEFTIETLKQVDGKLVIIREVRNRGSSWRVKYQTLDFVKSTEGFYEIDEKSPFVKACLLDPSLYKIYNINIDGKAWRPSILLPQRQTTVFHGREEQLLQLQNWYNDLDSHACLIYGEGGIGKTTLVLEFFNSAINNKEVKVNWLPEVICYYSAKQTKWGPGGLEYIRGVSPVVEEAIRLLVSVLENRLDRSWHTGEAKSLIDKAVALFREVGLERDGVLLILDNTETLARSSEQEENLAILLRQISSKLCRLLMTSRRYERVEARPIKVPEMDEDTGMKLLRRLGEVYNSQPIKQAGEAKLRKITRQLAGRPLLLDIFARYSSYAERSLDQSINLVLRDTRKDLGEFLFEDAWQRIEPSQRNVFLSLGQFGPTINGKMIGWVCSEFGVSHDLWLENFDETRFGTLVDYGSEYDVHLDASTREFLARQYGKLQITEQKRISDIVNKTNKQYNQYLTAQDAEITDRVADAFRTSAAKAAKLASKKGDIEGALIWYEEAISIDAVNAALWDRYAWFLMLMVGDLEKALKCAKEAIRLDDTKADYYYTTGTITARLGNIEETNRYMSKAEELGEPRHLCLNQRAVALIEASIPSDCTKWQENLDEANKLIKDAMNTEVDGFGYASKNHLYCQKLQKRSNDIRLKKIKGW